MASAQNIPYITFCFAFDNYVTQMMAYDTGKILLAPDISGGEFICPNYRLIQVNNWHESQPPKPRSFEEVFIPDTHDDINTVANKYNAAIAISLTKAQEMAATLHFLLCHRQGNDCLWDYQPDDWDHTERYTYLMMAIEILFYCKGNYDFANGLLTRLEK